jgi:hypothetical protein
MIAQVETFARALLKLAEAQLDWMDRKIEKKHHKALKDRHTLETCLIACLVLFLLAWLSGGIATMGRSICLLALIIVTLKLFQLMLIANQSTRRNWDE